MIAKLGEQIKLGNWSLRLRTYSNTGAGVLLCLVLMTTFSKCADPNEQLYGSWSATQAERLAGGSLKLDPAQIGFQFDTNGIYQYTSTLGYQEAGYYKRSGQKLVATDTTQAAPVEREAIIELLDEDSLHLRWKNQGQELLVKLIRASE